MPSLFARRPSLPAPPLARLPPTCCRSARSYSSGSGVIEIDVFRSALTLKPLLEEGTMAGLRRYPSDFVSYG
jgi:hypothetical protein